MPFSIASNYIATSAQLGFGVAEKLAETVVSGAAVDYVEFTGLLGNTDRVYWLHLQIINNYAGACSYNITYNAESTITNYYEQQITATSTTVSGARVNAPQVLAVSAQNDCGYAEFVIVRDGGGYFRAQQSGQYGSAAGVVALFRTIAGVNTTAEIIKLRIDATQAGGIGIGSVITLLRGRSK